jgi:hypothetical protein
MTSRVKRWADESDWRFEKKSWRVMGKEGRVPRHYHRAQGYLVRWNDGCVLSRWI